MVVEEGGVDETNLVAAGAWTKVTIGKIELLDAEGTVCRG